MSEITTRGLLEKAIKHVIQQGKPAVNEGGLYRYRTDNGLMCAVGALITDEYYSTVIEDKTLEGDVVITAVNNSVGRKLTNREITYLSNVQEAHDGSDRESCDFLYSFKKYIQDLVSDDYLPEYCLEFIV